MFSYAVCITNLILVVKCQTTYFTIWLNKHDGLVSHYPAISAQANLLPGGETFIVDETIKTWCLTQSLPVENIKFILDTDLFVHAKQANPTHVNLLTDVETFYTKFKPVSGAIAADILKFVSLITLPGPNLIYHDADVRLTTPPSNFELNEGQALKFVMVGIDRNGDDAFFSKRKVMADYDTLTTNKIIFNNDLVFLRRHSGDGSGVENVITILQHQLQFFTTDSYTQISDRTGGLHNIIDVFNAPTNYEYVLTVDQWKFYCRDEQRINYQRWITETGPVLITARDLKYNFVVTASLWQISITYLQQTFNQFYIPPPEIEQHVAYHGQDKYYYLFGLVIHGQQKGILNFYDNCILDPQTVGAVSRQNTQLWYDTSYIATRRQTMDIPVADYHSISSQQPHTEFNYMTLCGGTKRKKRNTCFLHDVTQYKVINRQYALVMFANRFIATLEKIKHQTLLVIANPIANGKQVLKLPASQNIINFFDTAERIAFNYAIRQLNTINRVELNLLNSAVSNSVNLLHHAKMQTLHNSIDNIASKVTQKLPRHIQTKARGWFIFCYVYNILDNSMSLVPMQSNALELTFLTTDIIESTGTLIALKFAKYDRTLFLSSFINKFTNNFIIRGIGNVASMYFLAHRIQILATTNFTFSDIYFTVRSIQHVTSIVSTTVGRIAPWLLVVDIAIMLRTQLMATSAELHNKLRILNLSRRDINLLMTYTFFNIHNDYSKLALFKLGADSLVKELATKLSNNIVGVVHYPHHIRENWDKIWNHRLVGLASSSCTQEPQDAKLSIGINTFDSSYNSDLSNIRLVPLSMKQIFLGDRRTIRSCVLGAEDDCAISTRSASYGRLYSRLAEARYGGTLERESNVCMLLDGSEPTGTACQRAQQLRFDEQQRHVYTPDLTSSGDERLLPTFNELTSFWISLVPKGHLEASSTTCVNLPTTSNCMHGKVAAKCTQYHSLKHNQLINPYIVSRNGTGAVLYLNTAYQDEYGHLSVIQAYPAIIIVPTTHKQVIVGSNINTNCFIVNDVQHHKILNGGNQNDILYLLLKLTNAIVDFKLNNIYINNNPSINIISIESLYAQQLDNSIIFANYDTAFLYLGSNLIINVAENTTLLEIQAGSNITIIASFNSTILINASSINFNLAYGANVIAQHTQCIIDLHTLNSDNLIQITFNDNNTIVSNNTFSVQTQQCIATINRNTNIQQIINNNLFWVTHLQCFTLLPNWEHLLFQFNTFNVTTNTTTILSTINYEIYVDINNITRIYVKTTYCVINLILHQTKNGIIYINALTSNTTIAIQLLNPNYTHIYDVAMFKTLNLIFNSNVDTHYYRLDKNAYYSKNISLVTPVINLVANNIHLLPGKIYKILNAINGSINITYINNTLYFNNITAYITSALTLPTFLLTNHTNERPFEIYRNTTLYSAKFI